jgi:DNA-binding transcriptional ArsR family regulator
VNPIGDGQELIDWLTSRMVAADEAKAQTNGHARAKISSPSPPRTDDEIIEMLRAAENAPKFEALYDRGDVHAYHGGDDSAADLGLLSMLAFYTQDAAQLESIFSSSSLGQRKKWRRRRDYRERTIDKALADLGEVYQAGRERSHPIGKRAVDLADSPYIGKSTKYASDEDASAPVLRLVRFAKRATPKPREFVVPDLIPRHHATTLYGWGGTAKSLLAMLLSLSVAGGRERFFDRAVAVHGPVLYLDFELDADEQQRRVMQLACGMNMTVPEDLLYASTLGFRTHDAIDFALGRCKEYGAVLIVLDSLGPAMIGDMTAAKDVIEFHNCYIAPFKAIGVTPILVDHQARQQSGEGYQAKGAFGSAYKEHLSRSLIQVEAGDRSAERGVLNVRLRHKKTNFGVLAEPFDVSLSFSDEMIVATKRELAPSERAQEATLNADERVVAALGDGPAYPDEIAEATGLARSTVKNKVNVLKKAGRVEITGEVRGQMEQVQLADLVDLPYKEKSAKSANPAQDNNLLSTTSAEAPRPPETVADLFANPPGWLPKQLEVYRKDPARHLKPLCATVAAEVLGDSLRGDEVRAEVKRILAEGTQS